MIRLWSINAKFSHRRRRAKLKVKIVFQFWKLKKCNVKVTIPNLLERLSSNVIICVSRNQRVINLLIGKMEHANYHQHVAVPQKHQLAQFLQNQLVIEHNFRHGSILEINIEAQLLKRRLSTLAHKILVRLRVSENIQWPANQLISAMKYYVELKMLIIEVANQKQDQVKLAKLGTCNLRINTEKKFHRLKVI